MGLRGSKEGAQSIASGLMPKESEFPAKIINPRVLELNLDPRSPTMDIDRTPIRIQLEEVEADTPKEHCALLENQREDFIGHCAGSGLQVPLDTLLPESPDVARDACKRLAFNDSGASTLSASVAAVATPSLVAKKLGKAGANLPRLALSPLTSNDALARAQNNRNQQMVRNANPKHLEPACPTDSENRVRW